MLPPWAVVKSKRLAHIERVAALMASWADMLGLAAEEKARWTAAAWLHDALRDEKPEQLRAMLPAEFAAWPGPLLHGPAAAQILREGGAADDALLRAIAYHTIGHPELDAAGRALYLADFLEPGRTFSPLERAVLRARMPHDELSVLRAVLRSRMAHLMSSHSKIRSETVRFWNSIAG